MRKSLVLISLLVLAASGCARFGTKQTDTRKEYDAGGKIIANTTVTTKAASYTLLSSTSDPAKSEAAQTEKSQRAKVGSLSQQGDTNLVGYIDALGRLAAVMAAEMAKMAVKQGP